MVTQGKFITNSNTAYRHCRNFSASLQHHSIIDIIINDTVTAFMECKAENMFAIS